jgi:hypothetical protein
LIGAVRPAFHRDRFTWAAYGALLAFALGTALAGLPILTLSRVAWSATVGFVITGMGMRPTCVRARSRPA